MKASNAGQVKYFYTLVPMFLRARIGRVSASAREPAPRRSIQVGLTAATATLALPGSSVVEPVVSTRTSLPMNDAFARSTLVGTLARNHQFSFRDRLHGINMAEIDDRS